MNRFIVYGLVPWLVLWGAASAGAQESAGKAKSQQAKAKEEASAATPAERYRDLLKAYQKAEQEFFTEYQKAKTDEERGKLIETKMPKREDYGGKMLRIALDAPKDPVAVEALVWAALNSGGIPANQAMKILAADHVQDPKIASLCSRLVYDRSSQSENLLREILAKNPGREAKGQACLALGQRLKMQADQVGSKQETEAMTREAETLLERVTKEFAEINGGRGTLGDTAKNELNELRNLSIGKIAPELKGEDIDGKSMKLTDFRGKVVVIDFWGDW